MLRFTLSARTGSQTVITVVERQQIQIGNKRTVEKMSLFLLFSSLYGIIAIYLYSYQSLINTDSDLLPLRFLLLRPKEF